jgi:polar amino acid transport system substrate-binding protein
VLLIIAGGLLLRRTIAAGQEATWARIQQTGVWRVGMDPSFPPFENLDTSTGQPVGFDVDLANAIARRWGVRAELVGVGFDQLVDAVAARRVDSAISALPVFSDRTKELSFSSSYVEAGIVLAAPIGSPIAKPEDLIGKRVSVEWGSAGDAEARALQQRLAGKYTVNEGSFDLVLGESADVALGAVDAGKADAVIVDAISLALYNRAGGRLAQVGKPLRSDPYVIVVPKGAPRLLSEVDDALAALEQDGTLPSIRGRWLDRPGR